ncbi:MAG: hypothetical protein E6J41_19055 [Chloroflexi bacterium]|nr:MAG: hypothetical protein E6J41_19055 [Chloroflexota bacterium]
MTLRLILGLGWSFVAGLAGGWLVLAPWALGVQGSGDWTTVTRTEVATGAGLVVLAVAGIVVVAVQSVRTLRESGVLAPSRATARTADGVTASPEMEKALIALAQALADDLDAQREPAPARAPSEAVWRQPS